MSNPLTRRTTLGFIPLVVAILLRHYYCKVVKGKKGRGHVAVPLRIKELMYDEAFGVSRNFMDAATCHTIEEMQKFSLLRTPIPPSLHVERLSVPLSCCADAARVLVDVFGGEQEAMRVLGGVRWWQVRPGDQGVDAEWIMEKKDWQQSVLQERSATTPANKEKANGGAGPSNSSPPGDYGMGARSTGDANAHRPEMDEMRCLLWAHGGGYFFGSVDQERYMIQRYARKIRGRAFAPNYRLAPQYPFPCAIQDLLASYLFLIQPPEGAAHSPIKPSNIVVGGDSAGGGLALALLQVIRDAGLPQPAGAVLVSPWCDLFHSFPSIFLNTDTDIVPASGLTLYKPSPLWPPPPDDVYLKVHDLLRSSVRGVVHPKPPSEAEATATTANQPDILPRFEFEPAPEVSGQLDQTMPVKGKDGNPVEITRQIQLYTTNAMLKHPLVSHVLAYLGGLPPLFFIASDREVLRDEIIYTAHRAANPTKYPVTEEAKKLYPALAGIEGKMKPTAVHLQVYDDAAHVLPLAFIATTPAKYCYRAVATFIKHVTNMPPTATLQRHKRPSGPGPSGITPERVTSPIASSPIGGDGQAAPSQTEERPSSRPKGFSRLTSFGRGSSPLSKSPSHSDIGNVEDGGAEDILAGDPIVYHGGWAKSPESQGMIRERVSIQGVIRPLEAEQDLPALQIMPELLGTVSERWLHRYIAGAECHDKKFAARIKEVAKRRERAVTKLGGRGRESHSGGEVAVSTGWNLVWALEADERPPPSSLVARCDMAEALALARGAKDRPLRRRSDAGLQKEQRMKTRGGVRFGTFWKRHASKPDTTSSPQGVVA